MWSKTRFEALNNKCKRYPQAKAVYDKFRSDMEETVSKPADIPLLGGGWSHNYTCPDDGDRLTLIDRHHHRCPTCGQVWSGKPWDDVAVANEHWNYARACRNAAIVYGMDGNAEWAEWAKSVLMFYADHYEQYELHDRHGGADYTAGKVMCQNLSEASWLCLLAQGCHILKEHGALSAEEVEHVAGKLFYPAIDVIRNNPAGISNWQTYHNAAKALTAAALNDRTLIEEAVYEPANGFYFQMAHSLGEDGFWYEGAWGYHFYTLEAQTLIVLAAESFGLGLYKEPRFQAMFRAPLECMQPDGTLPPIHDSGVVNLQNYAHLYEFAMKYFGLGGEVLADSGRDSLYSLLFGYEEGMVAESTGSPQASVAGRDSTFVNLKKAGMLFLKQQAERPELRSVAAVDYGEHGGFHGHRDKLSLIYYAGGRPWLTDAGMLPYGNPIHFEFFKQTVAHNTVAIGGRSQQEAEGSLQLMRTWPDGTLEAILESVEAYFGARMRRKIVITEDVLLDVFHVQCDEEQTVDWIIHTQGVPCSSEEVEASAEHKLSWRHLASSEASLGTEDGYSYLKQLRAAAPNGKQWQACWQWNAKDASGDRLQLVGLDAAEGEELFLAESIAMPSIGGKRSTFVRRRTGVKETVFAALFHATRGKQADVELSVEYDAMSKDVIVRIGGRQPVRLSARFE